MRSSGSIMDATVLAAVALLQNAGCFAASCDLTGLRWMSGVWRNVPPADPGEEQ